MFYTITFNPAVDLVMHHKEIHLGSLNRVMQENYVAGGKGINISVLLKRLGHDSIATGFLGGFTGDYIQQTLIQEGVQPEFIAIEAISRINVKIKADVETEINSNGPVISEQDRYKLFAYLNEVLTEDDIVLLAGNAAQGMTKSDYAKVAELSQQKKTKLVLDTNKELLTVCLKYRPFLLKPNIQELGEIFNIKISDISSVIHYARKLQHLGARHIIVSLGAEGAILITENDDIYQSTVPKGEVINSVGAGDSMVAGFMAKFVESNNFAESLRHGAACGSATAFSVGIAQASKVQQLLQEVEVVRIKE